MLEGGKTFAVLTGTAGDQIVLKRLPDAKFEYYNSIIECSLAVAEGKADAAAYDKPILKNIAAKSQIHIAGFVQEIHAGLRQSLPCRPGNITRQQK